MSDSQRPISRGHRSRYSAMNTSGVRAVLTRATASSAGIGTGLVCGQIWRKKDGGRSYERQSEQPHGDGRNHMIIQAELKRKQSEYEGEACSVDKVIELPAQRFRQFSRALLADYDFIAENKTAIRHDIP